MEKCKWFDEIIKVIINGLYGFCIVGMCVYKGGENLDEWD